MKNLLTKLFMLGMVAILLFGCSTGGKNTTPSENSNTESQITEEVDEDIVTITISKDEGAEVLTEKEVAIEDGAILMDVMKENFDIEEDGGFINGIDDEAPAEGEEKFWAISVNDEMAMVGAAELELTVGDDVVFDLQAWE